MKPIHIILIGLAGFFGLAGCSGSEPEQEPEPETVFDPLVESLDKARATQELEQERKQRIDDELEQN
jgi:hypothetical protein